MPGRTTPLVTGEFYHIFNRGSEKRSIFIQPKDYLRFQRTFFYYQFQGPKPKFSTYAKFKMMTYKSISDGKYIELLCYCLMPNHFHFLVKQLVEGGIAKFMAQLCDSYSKYFNTRYERVGPLWQGRFKSVRVESDEQLIHLSRYIHLNPVVSKLSRNPNKYQWSSFNEYMVSEIICNTKEILNFFKSNQNYREFVNNQIEYATSLEILKHHDFD